MCRLSLARWSIALAVNIMHKHGLSNEMCTQLQLKKTNVLAVNIAANGIIRTVQY